MDKTIKQGTRVYLRTPKRDEVYFIKSLWAAEKNLQEISASHNTADAEYQSWYAEKIDPGTESEQHLIIFENENDIPIGETGLLDISTETGLAELEITIKGKYRRRGFGREALMLLCDYFFIDLSGEILQCHVVKNNVAGQSMLANFGFLKGEETPEGIQYQLKKEEYLPD